MNREYELKIRRNHKRRIRQMRRRFLSFIITVMIVYIISFGLFSNKVKAESKDSIHLYKYYKSVTVSTHDTLWDYANKYSIDSNEKYIEEVKRMNHLSSDEIIVGMNLIIPYYSDIFVE